MYEIENVKTGKPIGNTGEDYRTFDTERLEVKTLDEVRAYLEQFKGHKRIKMYHDSKDNPNGVHLGYIYCFKSGDMSHAPVEYWYEQDWITVNEITRKPVII